MASSTHPSPHITQCRYHLFLQLLIRFLNSPRIFFKRPFPKSHHGVLQLFYLKKLSLSKHTEGRRQQYRTQVAFRLLRQSFNSKWNHHARCIPPALMKRHVEEFDKLVQNTAFSLVFGSPRTAGPETAVKHARLAAEEGGLGLKSLAANADITYLSAWNDTMREVKE